tara:strand:+ start:515 stop:2407 length:1893 start_codon:yes stop_codon:yes gene_type:complete
MCGISGVVSFDKKRPIDRDQLKIMADKLTHRGPDESGFYVNENSTVGFGFRRLSIIDIEGGSQPISSTNNSAKIIFNGEIYNHLEIRKILQSKGYVFRSKSDTECIVNGYLEWGKSVVNYLRGMFVFAIWDIKQNELFIARDRLGIKPLYYYHDNKSFIFASEIKAILNFPNIERQLNEKALYHYLTFAVSPVPDTMFENIKKLGPGETITLKYNGNLKRSKYWEPLITQSDSKFLSENEILTELKRLLRESTKMRMMSEVPIGAFLSGGVDSSLNVALMSEIMDKSVDTFSVAIDNDQKSNELLYARKVSKFFHTNHNEMTISNKDFIEFLPEMVKIQDEPIADPVCVPLYFVSKLARESGTYVIQVGEGVDELFCGYSLYSTLENFNRRYYEPFSKFPLMIKKILGGIGKIFSTEKKNRYFNWAIKNQELFWGGVNIFSEKQKAQILNKSYNYDSYLDFVKPTYNSLYNKNSNYDFISKMIYMDLKHRLPELLLMRVDKMAMASSVETRVPYLDHKLVEFALQIPSQLKYKNNINKYIFKKAARDFLPNEIIDRNKKGFCGSATNMVSRDLALYTKNEINNSKWMNDFFNINKINNLISSHLSNNEDNGMKIFNLLNLCLWQKEWFND